MRLILKSAAERQLVYLVLVNGEAWRVSYDAPDSMFEGQLAIFEDIMSSLRLTNRTR